MPKLKAARGAGASEKHAPLAEQILAGNAVRAGTREKRRGRGTVDEEEEYVGPRLSRRILQQARQQQEELETEHGTGDRPDKPRERATRLGESRRERRGWVRREAAGRDVPRNPKPGPHYTAARVLGVENEPFRPTPGV